MAEKTGRPKREFSEAEWRGMELMGESHCSQAELAAAVGTHILTLEREVKNRYGKTLDEWLDEKRCIGKSNIKQARYMQAHKRGAWRAIEWLSKQWLGETDKKRVDIKQTGSVQIVMPQNGREVMADDKQIEQDHQYH